MFTGCYDSREEAIKNKKPHETVYYDEWTGRYYTVNGKIKKNSGAFSGE